MKPFLDLFRISYRKYDTFSNPVDAVWTTNYNYTMHKENYSMMTKNTEISFL